MVAFTAEGRKIQAIKAMRVAARMDLKNAKETVERLQGALRQVQD